MRSYRIPQDGLKHVVLTPASQVTGIIGFCHYTHFISLCFHFLSPLGTTLCSSYRHMITPDSLFPEALKAKQPSHGSGLTIILTTEVFISEHTRISDLHVREGILRAMADHVSVLQRAHLFPGLHPLILFTLLMSGSLDTVPSFQRCLHLWFLLLCEVAHFLPWASPDYPRQWQFTSVSYPWSYISFQLNIWQIPDT